MVMEIEIYDAFKSAGLTDEKAHAVVDSIKKTINEHYALHSQQLATQGDVEKVRADVEKVRAEIAKLEGRLESRISASEANLIKWMVGAILTSAGLAMAIARVFLASN
jgi:demethoxyubiquinone hydroxylase (CLK1/Coq7/Cat5 family)